MKNLPPDEHAYLGGAIRKGDLGLLENLPIIKILGYGGRGIVFQGEDLKLKRMIAVKTPRKSVLLREPQIRDWFDREARAIAAVVHPNIVVVHRVSEHVAEAGLKVPFMEMELLQGESLQQRLTRQRKLPAIEAARIFGRIAEALALAHGRGLLHGDLKPSNVWLQPNGEPKVLDFGLAQTLNELHLWQAGVIAGTPKFMSPEQTRGDRLHEPSDLFSLGTLLYLVLTGEPPFQGRDKDDKVRREEIKEAVRSHQPPSPHTLEGSVPQTLSEITMRLLAKNPADRFSTALAVVAALEGVAAFDRPAPLGLILPSSLTGPLSPPILVRDQNSPELLVLSLAWKGPKDVILAQLEQIHKDIQNLKDIQNPGP
jgi:serine/threonine protein kinase